MASIVGPSLGGLLIALSNLSWLFLINALSFLPLLIGLALMRPREFHTRAPQAVSAKRKKK